MIHAKVMVIGPGFQNYKGTKKTEVVLLLPMVMKGNLKEFLVNLVHTETCH